MYRFLSIPLILLTILCSRVRAYSPQKINIYYDLNMVCISSNNKCWSFAKGSSSYPTPTWEGGRPLIIHHKNGFTWRNPLTGKIYDIGKHNLGDIWIQFYEDDNPLSPRYKWVYGFHKSPDENVLLYLQESHGCLRMYAKDLKEFSDSINPFDEFYIIRGAKI